LTNGNVVASAFARATTPSRLAPHRVVVVVVVVRVTARATAALPVGTARLLSTTSVGVGVARVARIALVVVVAKT
jgi:hypothetical protein